MKMDAKPNPVAIELEMQELEALESPGFWTGVSIGVAITASVAASVAMT